MVEVVHPLGHSLLGLAEKVWNWFYVVDHRLICPFQHRHAAHLAFQSCHPSFPAPPVTYSFEKVKTALPLPLFE